MTVFVGTSGWQYRHWRRLLYDRKPGRTSDIAWYGRSFGTVEANGTFYKLPEADTFARWRDETPDGFVFALKASRFLTHILRLRDARPSVERMMERACRLGNKLGPVLLQLPPTLRRDDERLAAAIDAFPAGVRVAVEFRHASWFDKDVAALLSERDAALCIADRGSKLITPAWRTASWGYVRFHEGRAHPSPCYGRQAIASRSRLIASLWSPASDVYVYFNNDPRGCAVRDAAAFGRAMRRFGHDVTRLPARVEIDRP
jgi:uncharacterized protein YecE (DUF72 family)